MRIIPGDFAASTATAEANGDAQVTLVTLKMPTGDVFLSDWPWGTAHGLAQDYQPIIEQISAEKDGGSISTLLSPGNLETGGMTLNLIFSDQTRALIFDLMNEGLDRRRVEVWKWFARNTGGVWSGSCAPLLHNVFFVQDNSSGWKARENAMIFPVELITATASENRKLSITDDPDKSYQYVIGKAAGMPLLELESSPVTQLKSALSHGALGMVDIENGVGFPDAGSILIDQEYITYDWITASTVNITARGAAATAARPHAAGAGIHPSGATYDYAVCLGPVGVLNNLKADNLPYNNPGVTYFPAENPARISFADRKPWLKIEATEGVPTPVSDELYYGGSYSDVVAAQNPADINRSGGGTSLMASWSAFGAVGTTTMESANKYSAVFPAKTGDSNYTAVGDVGGKFRFFRRVSEPFYGSAYISGAPPPADNEEASVEAQWSNDPTIPDGKSPSMYSHSVLHFYFFEAYTRWMSLECEISYQTYDQNAEVWSVDKRLFYRNYAIRHLTGLLNLPEYHRTYDILLALEYGQLYRVKMRMKHLQSDTGQAETPYARLDFGLEAGGWSGGSVLTNYHFFAEDTPAGGTPPAPSEITSDFATDLSYLGTFTSAKVNIEGIYIAAGAVGTIKVYENSVQIDSLVIVAGSYSGSYQKNLSLSATTWAELQATSLTLEVAVTEFGSEAVSNTAAITLSLNDGIQWLVSYEMTTPDSLKITYTDNLTVDATNSHGANPTPPQAAQYLIEDFTTYDDLIDTADFASRHAEYDAGGHYLNGAIDGSLKVPEALKKVTAEGFARFNHSQGKIQILSYLTDLAAVNVGEIDRYLFSPETGSDRGAGLTPRENVSTRMFFWWNKELSSGAYLGSTVKSEGTDFQNDIEIHFDLVDSDAACGLMATYLFDLSKSQFIETEQRASASMAYQFEKGDIVTVMDMTDSNLSKDFVIISSEIIHESAKLKQQSIVKIKMFKKL